MVSPPNDIPEEDLVALRAFAGNDVYRQINAALRAGDDAVLDRYDSLIRCAVSGLNQLPPYRGIAVSGATLDRAQLAAYRPGAVLHEPAFVSATRDPRLATPGNVRFAILSRHGHDISVLSPHPEEAEVLFGPGYRYTVTDVATDDGRWSVSLAESLEPGAVPEFAASLAHGDMPITRPERFSLPIGLSE